MHIAHAILSPQLAELGLGGCSQHLPSPLEEGKLILWNPPPVGPYCCPDCGKELTFDSVEIDLKNLILSERPAHCKKCDRYYYRSECAMGEEVRWE